MLKFRAGTKIVAIAGDPGGAAALAPVLSALLAGGVTLAVYGYRQAIDLLVPSHPQIKALPEQLPSDVQAHARRCLADSDALIAATSVNGTDWEKHFVLAAKEIGVPSVSVLDFWSNYGARFLLGGTLVAPDVITAMDEASRLGLIADGLPASRIRITGQPALEQLGYTKRAQPTDLARARRALGVHAGDRLILFASQAFAELDKLPNIAERGYDEHSVLDLLIPALELVSREIGQRIVLLIRPHPREADGAHAGRLSNTEIAVQVSRAGNSHLLVQAADLVTGMNSMLLVEACYLGCHVLSIQPGAVETDSLPTNATGLSRAVYDPVLLPETLREMLAPTVKGTEGAAATQPPICGDGTAATLGIVWELLYGTASTR